MEKTLGRPTCTQEIQPSHSKEMESCVFGRNDAVKTPFFKHLLASGPHGKTPDPAGGVEATGRRG